MSHFEPVSLLAHDNTFAKQLVNSPEWRTHEAQETAVKARADAAMAQAQMAEMEANMALMEANMNLMKIRAAMAEQQKAMEKQMKEMAEFMKPAKAKAPHACRVGVVSGQYAKAGSVSAKLAPHKLPVVVTKGGTLCKYRWVKLPATP